MKEEGEKMGAGTRQQVVQESRGPHKATQGSQSMAPAGHEVTVEEPSGQKPPGERNGERAQLFWGQRAERKKRGGETATEHDASAYAQKRRHQPEPS